MLLSEEEDGWINIDQAIIYKTFCVYDMRREKCCQYQKVELKACTMEALGSQVRKHLV